MAITRKTLAAEFEAQDLIIEAANRIKREAMIRYREQMTNDGWHKDEIKAEAEAFRKAFARLRAVTKHGETAVQEKDERADEIYAEITAVRAPRATRVEIIEQFDAETGEIKETSGSLPDATAGAASLLPDPAAPAGPIFNVPHDEAVAGSVAPTADPASQNARHEADIAGEVPRDTAPASHSPELAPENAEAAPQAGDGSAPHVALSPASNPPATEAGGEPKSPPVTDFVVFFDADADARCRKPDQCGSHSRLGVCEPCKQAWEADRHKVAAE